MSPPRRYELTDYEWSILAPLLPNKPRGVARADDRKVLNGIYWRLRTGSPSVFCRVTERGVLLDLRTVSPEEMPDLVDRLYRRLAV